MGLVLLSFSSIPPCSLPSFALLGLSLSLSVCLSVCLSSTHALLPDRGAFGEAKVLSAARCFLDLAIQALVQVLV